MSLSKLALLSSIASAAAHSASEWRERSIYQIITDRFWRPDGSTEQCSNWHSYCGGTWKGIEEKLDYIKGMGFSAIWISPIPQNKGDDYHGYAALNWYEVNSHFGTEQDLKDLVQAAHSKGIWVMLDVVANHVAPVDLDYSEITPFDKPEYYHSKCQIDHWDDPGNVEYCRLANLPDLNQDNEFVRSTLKQWASDTVKKYDFDGLRVDTTPEVKKAFWKEYTEAAGTFTMGEVFNGATSYVANYQYDALDATLNYPLYFALKDVFGSRQTMYKLRSTSQDEKAAFRDVSVLGNFIDNHDNERFLHSQPDVAMLKAALTYAMTSEGIPIMYYGTEQLFHGGNDPDDREPLWTTGLSTDGEMYKFVSQLNAARAQQQWWSEPQVERWADDTFYAFTRGDTLVVLSNQSDGDQTRSITYTDWEVGTQLVNFFDSSDQLSVGSGGYTVTVSNGNPKVYVAQPSKAYYVADSEPKFMQQ